MSKRNRRSGVPGVPGVPAAVPSPLPVFTPGMVPGMHSGSMQYVYGDVYGNGTAAPVYFMSAQQSTPYLKATSAGTMPEKKTTKARPTTSTSLTVPRVVVSAAATAAAAAAAQRPKAAKTTTAQSVVAAPAISEDEKPPTLEEIMHAYDPTHVNAGAYGFKYRLDATKYGVTNFTGKSAILHTYRDPTTSILFTSIHNLYRPFRNVRVEGVPSLPLPAIMHSNWPFLINGHVPAMVTPDRIAELLPFRVPNVLWEYSTTMGACMFNHYNFIPVLQYRRLTTELFARTVYLSKEDAQLQQRKIRYMTGKPSKVQEGIYFISLDLQRCFNGAVAPAVKMLTPLIELKSVPMTMIEYQTVHESRIIEYVSGVAVGMNRAFIGAFIEFLDAARCFYTGTKIKDERISIQQSELPIYLKHRNPPLKQTMTDDCPIRYWVAPSKNTVQWANDPQHSAETTMQLNDLQRALYHDDCKDRRRMIRERLQQPPTDDESESEESVDSHSSRSRSRSKSADSRSGSSSGNSRAADSDQGDESGSESEGLGGEDVRKRAGSAVKDGPPPSKKSRTSSLEAKLSKIVGESLEGDGADDEVIESNKNDTGNAVGDKIDADDEDDDDDADADADDDDDDDDAAAAIEESKKCTGNDAEEEPIESTRRDAGHDVEEEPHDVEEEPTESTKRDDAGTTDEPALVEEPVVVDGGDIDVVDDLEDEVFESEVVQAVQSLNPEEPKDRRDEPEDDDSKDRRDEPKDDDSKTLERPEEGPADVVENPDDEADPKKPEGPDTLAEEPEEPEKPSAEPELKRPEPAPVVCGDAGEAESTKAVDRRPPVKDPPPKPTKRTDEGRVKKHDKKPKPKESDHEKKRKLLDDKPRDKPEGSDQTHDKKRKLEGLNPPKRHTDDRRPPEGSTPANKISKRRGSIISVGSNKRRRDNSSFDLDTFLQNSTQQQK